MTGPVARFAKQIASRGYIVAAPSIYHEFVDYKPLAYDGPGTDLGNKLKAEKKLSAYDEDNKVTIDYLCGLPTCNGKIGATGMCLGGHCAFRAAFDDRVKATVTFFGTDIHSNTLGTTDDSSNYSLARTREIKGEVLTIFGTKDNHVPPEGRDLIRKTLRDTGVEFSFYEIAGAQHAFVRDESSKDRYDAEITADCLVLLFEMFNRLLKLDLGSPGEMPAVEDVC